MRIQAHMHTKIRQLAAIAFAFAAVSCASEPIGGPAATKPRYYQLIHVDNGNLPNTLAVLPFGGTIILQSATLIPYAVGKPGDQRLVDDRTGGGSTGGGTRDSTVARGQMMDLRIMRLFSGSTLVSEVRDSAVVDVVLDDSLFIITRPHPDPARVVVDTGRYMNQLLVVRTNVNLQRFGVFDKPRRELSYFITQ